MKHPLNLVIDFINSEPALVMGFIGAGLNLAIAFGLPVSTEQASLLNIFITATISIIVRQHVTPVVNLVSK